MRTRLIVFFGILIVGWFYHSVLKDRLIISYAPGDAAAVVAVTETESKEKELLPPPTHITPPKPVRALYMTSWVAGTRDWRDRLVRLIDEREFNSVVIDVKDYSGAVSFVTGNDLIASYGGEEKRVADMREFIDTLHRHDIYVIARITVFQDPVFSASRPAVAVQDSRGGLWKDKNGLTYVDPLAREFWDYIVTLSRVSEAVGFDELNFDYIRYPSDGPIQYAVFPKSTGVAKADGLEEFFQYLHRELKGIGVPLSADLFGFTTYFDNDLNIGQILERAEPYFDYLAPMVYPSHYPSGFVGITDPAAKPYEVIKISMDRAVARLVAASSSPDKLRPWLQDFDLGAEYDAAMIRKEKQAVYDSGLDSWMIWDPANRYTTEAYDRDN